ncbi:two component sensor transduction histidine kinase [Liquorilactobacillus capillatus DSM 19910]|uniref:histidine kinase n=2 Tax=Liquorilactobacillus capillatus TaxID=480931 RepID=A0A0R1MGP8_9LACO|nr:two component sensor transduction histidine kinase [Liquorilactobacillus capillatus DSM 19910]
MNWYHEPVTIFLKNNRVFLIILTALCLAIVLSAIQILGYQRQKKEIAILSSKLQAVVRGDEAGHLLLEPDDPYYELARAINGVQSMQRDISKDFTLQQRGYLSLLEYLTIGVLVLDQDQKIYLSNHAMSDLMGRELNVKGQLFVKEVRTYELSRLIEKTFETHQDQHHEIKIDATSKNVDAHVVYVPVSARHFLVMALLYDITELKEIERMQMDFVGNVSHELKTPITAITGFTETLLQGAMDDKQTREEFLKIVYQESLKLGELVEDILSLARIDSKPQLNLTSLKIYEFIEDILTTFQPELEKKAIKVALQIPVTAEVNVDKNKLRHVVNNLIQNGIKYNQAGGQLWINVQISQKDWNLSIKDNGYGIAKDEQERIFERFYRVDTSRSRQNGGTGLGLAVVQEYVKAMSGTIKVRSQVGVGSTFTVTFPLELKDDLG